MEDGGFMGWGLLGKVSISAEATFWVGSGAWKGLPACGDSLLMRLRSVFESLWCPVATCSSLWLEFMFWNSSLAQSTGADRHQFLIRKYFGKLLVSGYEWKLLIMWSPVSLADPWHLCKHRKNLLDYCTVLYYCILSRFLRCLQYFFLNFFFVFCFNPLH